MAPVTDYELAHEYETVNYHRHGGAAKIELNRPERLNAWNEQFSLDLLAALNAAAEDPDVRAVLITGAGRAFSSGADLGGDPEHGSGQAIYERLTKRYHPIGMSIRQMPKPVLSAVHGPAPAIGASLAPVRRLLTAPHSAHFLLPFATL